jgi:hypothetical protein
MKINKTLIRTLSAIIAFALLMGEKTCSGSLDIVHDEQMLLSFDSLFPCTPYKDALGACMQVLGYLDQLCHEHERGELATFGLVHDAFLGKVVSAQYKVERLVNAMDTGHRVDDDNVNYLSAILGYIGQLYKDRIAQEQRSTVATSIIDNMTLQILRATGV